MKVTLLALIGSAQCIKLNSDPICSSAGCTQYKHPSKDLGYDINYKVPNFGRDHDINDQDTHVKDAEARLAHTWTP